MKTYVGQNGHNRLITIEYCFFVMVLAISTVIAQEDTVKVSTGWNMVGSLYDGPVLTIIRTEPPDIIASQYFRYNPSGGYEAKDTLQKSVGYWVKVSADGILIFGNSAEWVCGNVLEYSEKIYHTVQIGSQCWLQENLNVGIMIVVSDTAKNNGIIEKYCYGNDPANCNTYGGLYNWDEAMQYNTTPGTRGICPTGWHIPTESEFQALSDAVGGNGNALKPVGHGTGGGAGTNTSGFSALPDGYRHESGYFLNMFYTATFISSLEYDLGNAYGMNLLYDRSDIYLSFGGKGNGRSLRCIKD